MLVLVCVFAYHFGRKRSELFQNISSLYVRDRRRTDDARRRTDDARRRTDDARRRTDDAVIHAPCLALLLLRLLLASVHSIAFNKLVVKLVVNW